MSPPPWREEPIDRGHDRANFDCGEPELNIFLAQHARQTHDRFGARTYVASLVERPEKVMGYYSLASAALGFDQAPLALRRGLARHDVPVYRLARLAVDLGYQGTGLGGQLFMAAGQRAIRAALEAGGVGLLIDAKNERVAAWYQRFGAAPLPEKPLSLVIPFSTLRSPAG